MRIYTLPLMLLFFSATHAGAQSSTDNASLEKLLTTECYDHVDRRSELIGSEDETSQAAYWQAGYVWFNDGWIPFEQAIQDTRQDPKQSEYERLSRGAVRNHVKLATWSLRNQRRDQYRAHMLVAAQQGIAALDAKTLRQMGYHNLNGYPVSPEQAYNLVKNRQATAESIAKYGRRLKVIRAGLDKSPKVRDRAKADLADINSPEAVDVVFQILGTGSQVCQREAARTLARIDSVRATRGLAFMAAFSPLESVRQISIGGLRNRQPEAFVPPLIDLLTSVSTSTTRRSTVGRTVVGSNWVKDLELATRLNIEKRHSIQSRISSLRYNFDSVWAPDPSGTYQPDFRFGGAMLLQPGARKLEKIRNGMEMSLFAAESRSAGAEDSVRALNARVTTALNDVFDESSDEPDFWWAWWNRYSDVEAPVKEVLEVEDDVQQRRVTFTVSASCFAAGTPVLTETGPRPIDSIRIGERVLSQDVDTGELRFRVVQKTTIRPPRVIHIINFDGDAIRCTGGHNFWRAGAGWVKARDLEVGDRIRTPTGTEAVTAVGTSEPAKTYNLVVEGFHTYFVGKSKLLVQDVLPITPTDNVLPGFGRFALGEDQLETTDLERSNR